MERTGSTPKMISHTGDRITEGLYLSLKKPSWAILSILDNKETNVTLWMIGARGLSILGRKQILEPEAGSNLEVRGEAFKEPLSERMT